MANGPVSANGQYRWAMPPASPSTPAVATPTIAILDAMAVCALQDGRTVFLTVSQMPRKPQMVLVGVGALCMLLFVLRENPEPDHSPPIAAGRPMQPVSTSCTRGCVWVAVVAGAPRCLLLLGCCCVDVPPLHVTAARLPLALCCSLPCRLVLSPPTLYSHSRFRWLHHGVGDQQQRHSTRSTLRKTTWC